MCGKFIRRKWRQNNDNVKEHLQQSSFSLHDCVDDQCMTHVKEKVNISGK